MYKKKGTVVKKDKGTWGADKKPIMSLLLKTGENDWDYFHISAFNDTKVDVMNSASVGDKVEIVFNVSSAKSKDGDRWFPRISFVSLEIEEKSDIAEFDNCNQGGDPMDDDLPF